MNNLQGSGNRSDWAHRQPQQMNILVWNAQGASSRQFLNVLREHIRRHRPSIVALVETRISGSRAQSVCNGTGFRRSVKSGSVRIPRGDLGSLARGRD